MLHTLIDNTVDMVIGKRIKNVLPVLSRFYKFVCFQNTQLVRYRRLRQSEQLRNVSYAQLCLKERVKVLIRPESPNTLNSSAKS